MLEYTSVSNALRRDIEIVLAPVLWPIYAHDLHYDDTILRALLQFALDGNIGEATKTLREQLVEHKRPALIAAFILEKATAALARHWNEDLASDLDVFLALNVLQTAFRSVFAFLPRTSDNGGGSVLVASAPAEPHVLGVATMSEILSEAGVSVSSAFFETSDALKAWVARDWVDAVTLHLSPICSREDRLAALPVLIEDIRNKSLNPTIRVAIQGACVLKVRQSALDIGANATSISAAALAPFVLRWIRERTLDQKIISPSKLNVRQIDKRDQHIVPKKSR